MRCFNGGGGGEVIAPFWQQPGIVAADFDADGRTDVAVATTYMAGPPPHAGYVAIYHQTAAGGFAAPLRYAVGPDPWGLSAGDVDGDGRLDLIAATPRTEAPEPGVIGDSGGVALLRQDPARPGRFLAAQWLATGGRAEHADVADLDADGLPDIAAVSLVCQAQDTPSRVSVLLQSPGARGHYTLAGLYDGSYSGHFITIADVDDDGLADLVLDDGPVVLRQRAAAPGAFSAVKLLR